MTFNIFCISPLKIRKKNKYLNIIYGIKNIELYLQKYKHFTRNKDIFHKLFNNIFHKY